MGFDGPYWCSGFEVSPNHCGCCGGERPLERHSTKLEKTMTSSETLAVYLHLIIVCAVCQNVATKLDP